MDESLGEVIGQEQFCSMFSFAIARVNRVWKRQSCQRLRGHRDGRRPDADFW